MQHPFARGLAILNSALSCNLLTSNKARGNMMDNDDHMPLHVANTGSRSTRAPPEISSRMKFALHELGVKRCLPICECRLFGDS